jgi:hypothetical protein
MTKLQSIVAELKNLPVEEQLAVFSEFRDLVTPVEDDIFELTDAELAEFDRRVANDTETLTMEEVFGPLREKYGLRNIA